jgi:hypothetical protein
MQELRALEFEVRTLQHILKCYSRGYHRQHITRALGLLAARRSKRYSPEPPVDMLLMVLPCGANPASIF